MSILEKIVEKSQIWLNLSKIFQFGQNCRKFSILVKIFKKISISVKINKNLGFW